jgi:hypothetical protein
MLRSSLLCLVAGSCVSVLTGAAAAESFTTRIEPRPIYGATITREQGVRVIRPLPPVRQVIINPNGTPLTLGFSDSRVYEYSSSTNYNYSRGDAYGGDGIYSAPLWGGGGWGKGRRGFFHNGGPHPGMGGGHHGRGGGVR